MNTNRTRYAIERWMDSRSTVASARKVRAYCKHSAVRAVRNDARDTLRAELELYTDSVAEEREAYAPKKRSIPMTWPHSMFCDCDWCTDETLPTTFRVQSA